MRHLAVAVLLLSAPVLAQMPAPSAPPRPPAVRTPGVAPNFPAPGSTPAGAGLTTVGLPGQEVSVPRSPDQRVLPSTSEPGLWAGDEARASIKNPPKHTLVGPPPPTTVRGHELPHLDGINPRAFSLSINCGISITDMLNRMPPALKREFEAGHRASGNTQLQCTIARGYLACLEQTIRSGGWRHGEHFEKLPADRGDIDKAKATTHARRHAKANCPDQANTIAVDKVVEYMRDAMAREQS